MKKTASIIVTFNGEKWIRKCLESLLESSTASEIFVVDNQSLDSTVSIVKEFPVHLEVLPTNSGFGYANNFALKKTLEAFDYFFLVNQDLYVENDTLKELLRFAENHPEFGIVAPIQYDGKGEKIDTNFSQYLSKSIDKGEFYETDFCNAAAWLVSKTCLKKVGFFSEHFPHYGEDRNFCERAKFHHFEIAILKNTKVHHDREQKMNAEKAIKLGKIKLLTIFLNPNFSQNKSIKEGLKNAFGISKFIFKKQKTFSAFFPLLKEFLRLFQNRKYWESEKNRQK